MAFLEAIAAGRRVLDVGVVSPGAHGAGDGKWRHGRIAAAASCLGVDILAPEVEELRRRGFNVVAADATSDRDLGERFDVVSGDVIEHVSRPSICSRSRSVIWRLTRACLRPRRIRSPTSSFTGSARTASRW